MQICTLVVLFLLPFAVDSVIDDIIDNEERADAQKSLVEQSDVNDDSISVVSHERDRVHWVDPFDMSPKVRYGESKDDGGLDCKAKLAKTLQKLSEFSKKPQTCGAGIDSPNPSTAILKHLVRLLLKRLDLESTTPKKLPEPIAQYVYEADLVLSAKDLHLLQKFLTIDQKPDALIVEVFGRLFSAVRPKEDVFLEAENFFARFLGELRSYLSTLLLVLNIFLLVPAAVHVIRCITGVSWFRLSVGIFYVVFWLSVTWTWFHLYKVKQAEQKYRLLAVPRDCIAESLVETGFGKNIKNWFLNVYSAQSISDKCLQYHKDLLIDPVWEVTITDAFAVTVTKFCLQPLTYLGHHLGVFFRTFYAEIPLLYVPIVSLMLAVLLIVILISCGHARVTIPFCSFEFGGRASLPSLPSSSEQNSSLTARPCHSMPALSHCCNCSHSTTEVSVVPDKSSKDLPSSCKDLTFKDPASSCRNEKLPANSDKLSCPGDYFANEIDNEKIEKAFSDKNSDIKTEE